MTDRRERELERLASTGDKLASRTLRRSRIRSSGLTRVLRLDNARLGFASNSSSSHSVIIAPGLSDSLSECDGALSYGWGNFVLASTREKAKYFAVACASHYRRYKGMGQREILGVVRQFFNPENVTDDEIWNGYIDHQSAPSFPVPKSDEQGMDAIWELIANEIVCREDAVVLGGNDNDEDHPLRSQGHELDLYNSRNFQFDMKWRDAEARVFWHDPRHHHFTVFNRNSGTRLRFKADRLPPSTESTHPELVEIKITDYCEKGCDYCYQDSSPKGQHAGTGRPKLNSLAWRFRNSGVFEVAIGGGEPTSHPQFLSFLEELHESGVVPNFSTQRTDWLDDPEFVKVVSGCCGAVALSTQDPDDVQPWISRCHKAGIKGHLHYVLGLSPLSNFAAFLEAGKCLHEEEEDCECYMLQGHLVLLAYKGMGRAAPEPPYPYQGKWGKVIQEALHEDWSWSIAVDGPLLDETKDLEEELGFYVRPTLYEQPDGLFSCYYDAVTEKIAANSFAHPGKMIDCNQYDLLRNGWSKVKALTKAHGLEWWYGE